MQMAPSIFLNSVRCPFVVGEGERELSCHQFRARCWNLCWPAYPAGCLPACLTVCLSACLPPAYRVVPLSALLIGFEEADPTNLMLDDFIAWPGLSDPPFRPQAASGAAAAAAAAACRQSLLSRMCFVFINRRLQETGFLDAHDFAINIEKCNFPF
jgi:hypothetical protein